MELTLTLDASAAAPTPDAVRAGVEATEAGSAFAALLATLAAPTGELPTAVPALGLPADPATDAEEEPTGDAPTAMVAQAIPLPVPVLPLALALPAAVDGQAVPADLPVAPATAAVSVADAAPEAVELPVGTSGDDELAGPPAPAPRAAQPTTEDGTAVATPAPAPAPTSAPSAPPVAAAPLGGAEPVAAGLDTAPADDDDTRPAPTPGSANDRPLALDPRIAIAPASSSPSLPDSTSSGDEKPAVTPQITLPTTGRAAEVQRPTTPAPAPPAPPTPVEQVVRVVAPLRRLADGDHRLVLELRPADLGAVRVELSLERGVVHLGLRADVEGTSQLLRAALPELRQQLEAAGLESGRLDVDARSGAPGDELSRGAADPDGRRRPPDAPAEPIVPDPTPTPASSPARGHVDVLL